MLETVETVNGADAIRQALIDMENRKVFYRADGEYIIVTVISVSHKESATVTKRKVVTA